MFNWLFQSRDRKIERLEQEVEDLKAIEKYYFADDIWGCKVYLVLHKDRLVVKSNDKVFMIFDHEIPIIKLRDFLLKHFPVSNDA
jgi:hypothetical protein